MALVPNAGRIMAVLGPTNTGKTHFAIERMLGHASGMIGFPLRLLARENYDRVARLKGARAVALITGEEKIIPPNPTYFVCTVESMPLDRAVDFLAVDEIQLAADPARGHIFTSRLLHARGRQETMFLGSETIRPLIRRLLPEAEQVNRPRLSMLTYTGPKKVTRLPPRSAVVAFSVADVFSIAELVRRQRGGTAVVLGALSPQARNAQVALYQSGEVDYMVATDAIGMGLNMDLDHVAFARLAKFDGRTPRRLTVPEIAQIAGRAGRHMNDGTFGTTAEVGSLDEEVVEAVENHRFDPLTHLYWRNPRLDFHNGAALLRSLEEASPMGVLMRAPEADDHATLQALMRQPDIRSSAGTPANTRLLWEVCQIPDFRKIMSDHHVRLLAEVYRHLTGAEERLPAAWVEGHIQRLDRIDGDIDSLVTRMAHVRTWTYITHRGDWLDRPGYWQERARALEDKLSHALHERITQRFVDRRQAFLLREMAKGGDLLASVSREGEVRVEGQFVGELDGFRFIPDAGSNASDRRQLLNAANRVLRNEVAARADKLLAAPEPEFSLAPDGRVLWQSFAVGQMKPGPDALSPRVELLPAEFLEGGQREQVRLRLQRAADAAIARVLAPLTTADVRKAEGGAARGILFQVAEGLGSTTAGQLQSLVRNLTPPERKLLARLKLSLGTETAYFRALLRPEAMALRALLWRTAAGRHGGELPQPGRVSIAVPPETDHDFLAAVGFPVRGARAIRADRLEIFALELRKRARSGPFAGSGELAALLGCPAGELPEVLAGMGYRAADTPEGPRFSAQPRRPRKRSGPKRPPLDGAFASLSALRHVPSPG